MVQKDEQVGSSKIESEEGSVVERASKKARQGEELMGTTSASKERRELSSSLVSFGRAKGRLTLAPDRQEHR